MRMIIIQEAFIERRLSKKNAANLHEHVGRKILGE
jgi:hypothetical protein